MLKLLFFPKKLKKINLLADIDLMDSECAQFVTPLTYHLRAKKYFKPNKNHPLESFQVGTVQN